MATRDQKNINLDLIKLFGNDLSPSREGLIETPKRIFRVDYKEYSKEIFKTFNTHGCKSFTAVMGKGLV